MNAVFVVIAPVFGIVLLGYGLARKGIFNAPTSDGLTKFMFYVAIPAMLFQTLASTPLPPEIPWRLLGAFYVPSFLVFGLAMLVAARTMKWARNEQGIAGISSAYSNMVLLGLPLIVTAFGESASLPLFILLAPQSMIMFPLTTFVIEVYGRESDPGADRAFHPVLSSIARLSINPVILSLVLGIAANLNDIRIAGVLATILDTLSDAAPACALTALGVSLAQYRILGGFRYAAPFVVLKNIAHPMLVFAACHWLSVDPDWTRVAVLLAAMPCGINAFIFARNYELQGDVVTKTIIASTMLSTVTVALLLHLYLNN